MNCLHCGQEVPQTEGKRQKSYCNDAHKKAFQRNMKLVDNGTPGISGHITGQSDESKKSIFEKVDWSLLSKSERHARGEKIKSAGCVLTGGFKLPANYKTAAELAALTKQTGKPQFNRVNRPGDPDYDGVCTAEWIAERQVG